MLKNQQTKGNFKPTLLEPDLRVKRIVIINIFKFDYTQYPFIRNALIRNNAEISGNFKKPAFKGSNLRNALK